MNKKIAVGAGIVLVSIVVLITGIKTYFGDSATELPGEEKAENSLHLQESGTEPADATEPGESAESGEDTESSGNYKP